MVLSEEAEEFAQVNDFAIIMAVARRVAFLFRKLNQSPLLQKLVAIARIKTVLLSSNFSLDKIHYQD